MEDWRDHAACKDMGPDVFFPDQGRATTEGKRTCMRCVVRSECLQYAIDAREPYGIWGGLNEKERRRMRREQLRDARTAGQVIALPLRPGRPTTDASSARDAARNGRTISPMAADG